MLDIQIIPMLSDNYAYLLHNGGETAVVDPSEAEPVLASLQRGKLDYILSTHHHWDHTGGNLALKAATNAQIIGFEERIPGVDVIIEDGNITVMGAKVMFIPGHTLGAVAYWFPEDKAVFTGDTLFSIGCGRLFEGTAEQMYHSLQKLAALPEDTRVYPGHEYTLANAAFALTVEPGNADLQRRYAEVLALSKAGNPTIPSTIGMERKTNPFLRCDSVEAFADLRKQKDNFTH